MTDDLRARVEVLERVLAEICRENRHILVGGYSIQAERVDALTYCWTREAREELAR